MHRDCSHAAASPLSANFYFSQMIDVITAEIMPSLRESGMSGQVEFLSDLRVFNDHQRSAQAS